MWCFFHSFRTRTSKGRASQCSLCRSLMRRFTSQVGRAICCVKKNLAANFCIQKNLFNLLFFSWLSSILNGIQQLLPVYTLAVQPHHKFKLELKYVISIILIIYIYYFFFANYWFLKCLDFVTTFFKLFLPSGNLFDTTTDHLIDANLDFSAWISHSASVFLADRNILSFE